MIKKNGSELWEIMIFLRVEENLFKKKKEWSFYFFSFAILANQDIIDFFSRMLTQRVEASTAGFVGKESSKMFDLFL